MKQEEYIKKHNLDEIDSFLFKEFGIMGGACSAQKASEYHTARMVAEKLWKKEEPVSEGLLGIAMELEETIGASPHSRLAVVEHLVKATNWQKQKTIGKAVDWLYQQQISVPNIDEFIEDFRKEMED